MTEDETVSGGVYSQTTTRGREEREEAMQIDFDQNETMEKKGGMMEREEGEGGEKEFSEGRKRCGMEPDGVEG